MKKITVLGGSGFLGARLVSKLVNQSFEVKTMIHTKPIKSSVKKFKGDILSRRGLEKKLNQNEIIINLTGQFHHNKTSFFEENIIGSINLLETSIKKKVKKIILISSINVYGESRLRASKESDVPNPRTYYGIIKLATEFIYQYYSETFGLNVIILRLANVYGPEKKSGLIGDLIKNVNLGKESIIYHQGKQFRDFIFVDDAIDAIIQAIKTPINDFNIFNISSNRRYMFNDLIALIQNITKKKLKIKRVPNIKDEKYIWANNNKAKNFLKFQPRISLKEGMIRTFDSKKNNLLKFNEI